MKTAFEAMQFARHAHRDQKRKYTGNPYADHLAEVAGITASVVSDLMIPAYIAISVAWLHDSVEDCGVEVADIEEKFGSSVAYGVEMLSDLETGNRALRKAFSRNRLATAPDWVQSIKCADLISNTSSIIMHDPKFAEVYLEEKRLLLDVLNDAHPALRKLAREQASLL